MKRIERMEIRILSILFILSKNVTLALCGVIPCHGVPTVPLVSWAGGPSERVSGICGRLGWAANLCPSGKMVSTDG